MPSPAWRAVPPLGADPAVGRIIPGGSRIDVWVLEWLLTVHPSGGWAGAPVAGVWRVAAGWVGGPGGDLAAPGGIAGMAVGFVPALAVGPVPGLRFFLMIGGVAASLLSTLGPAFAASFPMLWALTAVPMALECCRGCRLLALAGLQGSSFRRAVGARDCKCGVWGAGVG